jgi:uncharacterized protein YbjT (DUF2867 family)
LQLDILLAGATGLVGRALLSRLVAMENVSRIDVVGRRETGEAHPKITEHLGAVEDWPALVAKTRPDIAISTLGTTMRLAGSEAAFAAIDHDAIVAFARAACGAGADRFMAVSSVGAHSGSRNFYLATKGRAEADLSSIGFSRLDIFRPGLLRGHRTNDQRLGEKIGIAISPITDFLTPRVLDHYRSISIDHVAAALTKAFGETEGGMFIHENRAMWDAIGVR